MVVNIGLVGFGCYFPSHIQTAEEFAPLTGIPLDVIKHKMGIVQRHIASEKDTVSHMASEAGKRAIEMAGISPEQVKMVISHGSEYKDHVVWNAAGKIQHNVGAINAFAFEMYALCAGAPIALHTARSMMMADDSLEYVLLAAGSRENDLISPTNPRARFMYNFGAGASAMLLKRNATENLILGASAITDGSLSETVMLTTEEDAMNGQAINGEIVGWLDVRNADYMAERLGETSLPNFKRVITESVEKGGNKLEDVKFLGITHMKKSFYHEILASVGLTPEQSVYLDYYGHVQSADQAIALQLGLEAGKIKKGDLIVLAGAGTGYTWSAVSLRWG